MAKNYLRKVPSYIKSTIDSYKYTETLPDVWFVAKSLAGGTYRSGSNKNKITSSIRNSRLLAYPHTENRNNKLNEATGVSSFKITVAQAISLVDTYTIQAVIDEHDIDIMEGLFMAPGIHVILEWGHRDAMKHSKVYGKYPPDGKAFSDGGGSLILQYKKHYGFDKGVKNSKGRYGYAIAAVVNFDYTYDASVGVYNVAITLVGAGYIDSFSLFGNIVGVGLSKEKTKNKINLLNDYLSKNYINIGSQGYELFQIGESDSNHNLRMQEIMNTILPPVPDGDTFRDMLDELVPIEVKDTKEVSGKKEEPTTETPTPETQMVPLMDTRPEFIYYNIKSIIDYITSSNFDVVYYLDYNDNMESINDSILTYDLTALALLGNYAYAEGSSFDIFISKSSVDQHTKWFIGKTVMESILYLLELANKALLGHCKFTADMIEDQLVIYDEYYVGNDWLNKPLRFDVSRKGLQKGIVRALNIKTSPPKNVVDYWTANSYTGREYKNDGSYQFFNSHSTLTNIEDSATPPKEETNTQEAEQNINVPEIMKYEKRIMDALVYPVPENTHRTVQMQIDFEFGYKKTISDILLSELPDIKVLSSIIIKSMLYNAISDINIDLNTIIKVWTEHVDNLLLSKKLKPKSKFDALPVDVNLSLTGVAGIAPFMYFKMSGATSRMSSASFYYMITTVEHVIANHNWDVNIGAFLRTDMR